MARQDRIPDSVLIAGGALLLAAAAGTFFRRAKNFHGKVAVITGGSRGLGLALARILVAEGARVNLIARDARELQTAACSLEENGEMVRTWPCDLRDRELTRSTIAAIIDVEGGIDLLINNAGTILVGPLETMTDSDFEDAMALHLWAPFTTISAALPSLAARRGGVVNIASIGGKIAVPHLASYTASKFALVGLSQALYTELSRKGVAVTTVCPGLMRTGSHVNAVFKGDVDREFTWFSVGASTPLTAMGAARAARRILAAAKKRKPSLVIGLQARTAVLLQSLFPNLFLRTTALVNRLLPGPNGDKHPVTGKNCFSKLPGALTVLGDRAGAHLNEV